MKEYIITILATLFVIFTLIWLIGSFIAFDMNPLTWHIFNPSDFAGRTLIMMTAIFSTIAGNHIYKHGL